LPAPQPNPENELKQNAQEITNQESAILQQAGQRHQAETPKQPIDLSDFDETR
jgi:hypothetical protein